ncbi:MAG: RNA polymerase sigma factor [Actinomycetota bacterium]|nr:RNA polymerase sigma factor [Actinomycetota bacterium]
MHLVGGERSSRVTRWSGTVSDEALVAGMAARDERSAEEFVQRYERRVYGLALSMLADRALAEDVAQEALLRAWRHAAVFDPARAPVASWLLTIARNLAIDALRLRRSVPVDDEEIARLGGDDRSADRAIEAALALPGLKDALGGLPPEQRRALVLAHAYGYTAAEIGRMERIPLGTAKTRIRTGMAKLRDSLDGGSEEGGGRS